MSNESNVFSMSIFTKQPLSLTYRNIERRTYRGCSIKKLILEILQYSQENTCLESLLKKLWDRRPAILLKKGLLHRCFPVNIAKFLRASANSCASVSRRSKTSLVLSPMNHLVTYAVCFKNIKSNKVSPMLY